VQTTRLDQRNTTRSKVCHDWQGIRFRCEPPTKWPFNAKLHGPCETAIRDRKLRITKTRQSISPQIH